MTSLVVMNESLVTRMVNDVVTQRRVPPFRPRYDPPTRLSEPKEARKQRWSPDSIRIGSRRETRASPLQFSKNRLLERLRRLGNAVHPQRESSRLDQIGDSSAEAPRFHPPQRFNSTGLLRPRMSQTAGRKNLSRPFFQRWPFWRWSVAPVGLHAFPRGPCLLRSEVFVRVVHQSLEPPLSLCFGEVVRRDPLLERTPKRELVLSLPPLIFQEAGATRLQCRTNEIWEVIGGLSNGANPQNEDVPLCEGLRALCQLRPRYQECLLQGFLLAVAPYIENEVCVVCFCHQRPVSGGGSLDRSSKLSYCTNSNVAAKESNGLYVLVRDVRIPPILNS